MAFALLVRLLIVRSRCGIQELASYCRFVVFSLTSSCCLVIFTLLLVSTMEPTLGQLIPCLFTRLGITLYRAARIWLLSCGTCARVTYTTHCTGMRGRCEVSTFLQAATFLLQEALTCRSWCECRAANALSVDYSVTIVQVWRSALSASPEVSETPAATTTEPVASKASSAPARRPRCVSIQAL